MLLPMLVGMGACSAVRNKLDPDPANVRAQAVTYTIDGIAMSEVSRDAADQCAAVGKSARMRHLTQAEGQMLAVFDCQ